ncbi:MAG: ATP-binding protein [Caldilineaceae bacterium]|jgi:serine/threonine-protein kinase RsbW
MASLIVSGALTSLDEIRTFVNEQARSAGLDERRTYRLSLAVDEIATNIINYGYVSTGVEGEVRIISKDDNGDLVIVLEDSSPPFDPFSHARPDDLDAPLEERDIGGLGIFLASQNVDEFRYEHADGSNRNIFVVHKQPSDGSSESQP